mgnify:CR=1 FL=1
MSVDFAFDQSILMLPAELAVAALSLVADFSTEARKKGLLLVGAAENTIRILPPLNTSFEEIDLAFLKLKEISQELHKKND